MDIESSEEEIYEFIKNLDQQELEPRDYSDQAYLFDTKNNHPIITDSDHEIVAEISITLLKKNSESSNSMPDTVPLYNNNYWIPLNSGDNVVEYCNTFLNHFQNAMTGSI